MKVEKLSDSELDGPKEEEYYEAWHICQFCLRAYNTPSRFLEHKREAHKDEEEELKNTSNVSSSQVQMSSYGRKITCVNQKQESDYFPNANYGKRYQVSTSSHRRLLNHSKNKTHKCSYCGKKFQSNSRLKLHEVIHSNLRPFKCQAEGCEYSANRRYALSKHEKTHSGTVNIRLCTKCQKFFRRDTTSKLYETLPNTCNSCYRSTKLPTK